MNKNDDFYVRFFNFTATYLYMMYRGLLIIFLFLFSPLKCVKASTPLDWEKLDGILRAYRQKKDFGVFEAFNDPDQQMRSIQPIILKIVRAEQIAAEQDKRNTKSEQLFEEAYLLAEKTEQPALLIWAGTRIGFYYYTYSQPTKALPYFLAASKLLDQKTKPKLLEATDVLLKNSYYFGNIGDISKAIHYLEMALDITPVIDQEYATVLYSLGAHYLLQNKYSTAAQYFLAARNAASHTGNKIRYAKALGELGHIAFRINRLESAEKLFLKDIEVSKIVGDLRNTMYAQIKLSKIYIRQGQFDSAKNLLTEAERYAISKDYLKGFEQDIAFLRLNIAQQENDTVAELNLYRHLQKLEQYIAKTDGKSVTNRINIEVQKERIKWKLENQQVQLEKARLIKTALLLISFLLLIVVILIFILNRRKLKLQASDFEKKMMGFQLEKVVSEKKLHDTHNTLDSYRTYLEEKNNQIEKLESEILKIKNRKESQLRNQQGELEHLLESHLMTEDSWLKFKATFRAERRALFDALIQDFPGITESQLRIVLLQNLGLNKVEIANMLGVTVDAVKKSKQRLRKKYGENADHSA